MRSHLVFLLLVSSCGLSSAGIFSKRNLLLKSFKHKTCAEHPGVVSAQELSLSSTSDGDLIIGGGFVSGVNLTSPLKVQISMSRNVLGLNIPMPCFKKFGSCTFDNVCDFGFPNNQLCPGKLDEHDIPCRCPIETGVEPLQSSTNWDEVNSDSCCDTVKKMRNGRAAGTYTVFILSKDGIYTKTAVILNSSQFVEDSKGSTTIGRYDLPGAQFSIDPTRWAGLLAGTYSGTARLFSNSVPLACYNFVFELQ